MTDILQSSVKVRSLDKKWKEFLFAFSGFGPNLLMVLMGAFFSDAINPSALLNSRLFASMHDVCLILPALFPILYAIAKAFDGIIDIPFAYITDTLSTKWGRRRPAIFVCAIPMIVSFAFCWWPVFGTSESAQLGNTIWIIAWALVFFSTYTMCLIAYYGSLSTVCEDEPQRLRVSGYKSFFDTISYCIVYALVPLLLNVFKLHIDQFVFISLPLMLTIFIPIFMIKEGEKYGYPENQGLHPEKITLKESFVLTFKNKIFVRWLVVNACTFFGMQMFLVSMNALIGGGMGLNEGQMAILNTCAFAPVPIMLYLFNKLKAKKGIRFTYQTCLLAFAIAILSFLIGSRLFFGDGNVTIKIIIGCVGGVMGSWAIGAFFMMPYIIPTQISAVEEKLTGKNHSAMYFGAQAFTTSVVGAISGNFVYESIKNIFFTTDGFRFVSNCTDYINDLGVRVTAIQDAATKLGLADTSQVFNLATTLVPIIVSIFCIAGFFLAFRMPKDFTHKEVVKEMKRLNPELNVENEEVEELKEEKSEIIFVQIGLSILSGFIFGFIWLGFLLKSLKELLGYSKRLLTYLLSCFVPFAQIYFVLKIHSELKKKAQEKGIRLKGNAVLFIILSILFPILPINVITLALLQSNVNSIYNSSEKTLTKTVEA